MTQPLRVLHVDDDPAYVEVTREWLERENGAIEVAVASSADGGLAHLESTPVDCIVSDYEMPGTDGIDFLRQVREDHPDLPFILFTGKGSEEVASEAINAGVTDYLQKTGDPSQYAVLANRINNAVEQARAKRELDASRDRLELFFEASPMGAIEWDEDLTIARLNERARGILGAAGDELIDEPVSALVPEDHRGVEGELLETIVAGEADRQAEAALRRVDGEQIICEWHHRVVTDDGDVLTRFSKFTDVSERKRRERELRAMHALSSTLFDGLPVGVLVEEPDGSVLAANDRMADLLELPADVAEAQSVPAVLESIKPQFADTAAFESFVDACLDRGEAREGERFELDDGRILEVSHRPLELPGGDGHLWMGGDVTERARTQRALADHLDALERLHEATNRLYSAESVAECHDVTIETAVEILGFDWCMLGEADDDTGRFRIRGASPGSPLEVGDLSVTVDDGLVGHAFQTGESNLVDDVESDDRSSPQQSGITSVVTVPVGDWGVIQAISAEVGEFDERDLRHAELLAESLRTAVELLESQAALERERNRLDDFTEVVSHDLRNPLAVAQGHLELIDGADGDDEHIEGVGAALERMTSLIEHLQSLASEGSDLGERELVDLEVLTRAAWRTVEASDASVTVDTDRSVYADRTRLRQLVENLLRNAVEHGGEDVSIAIGDLEDGFFVADDGAGIPPADREAIFESGYSTSDRDSGVGLTIVREIADAHGWEIDVTKSREGGARFELIGLE